MALLGILAEDLLALDAYRFNYYILKTHLMHFQCTRDLLMLNDGYPVKQSWPFFGLWTWFDLMKQFGFLLRNMLEHLDFIKVVILILILLKKVLIPGCLYV